MQNIQSPLECFFKCLDHILCTSIIITEEHGECYFLYEQTSPSMKELQLSPLALPGVTIPARMLKKPNRMLLQPTASGLFNCEMLQKGISIPHAYTHIHIHNCECKHCVGLSAIVPPQGCEAILIEILQPKGRHKRKSKNKKQETRNKTV